MMSERVSDEVLKKQINQLKNENCHLRDTVTLLRNEMEQLNEQKNYDTSVVKEECPVKRGSTAETCHLKARMDLLLERLTDFTANIYSFREESQE